MKSQSMYPHPAVRRQTPLAITLRVLALFSLLMLSLPAQATEPSERADPLSVRFEGTVRALGPTKWIVGQQSVFVSESTTLIEKVDRAGVGAWVIVMAKPDGAGGLHATYIIVISGGLGGGGKPIPDQQISGRVESITISSITVAGKTIAINFGTDMPVVPQVGAQVRVIAEPTDLGGGLVAFSIEIIANAGSGPIVEFEGTIHAMQSDTWIVDGRRLEITAGTKIYGAQAAIGKNAEVQALQTGGRLIAQAIRVTEPSAEVAVNALVAAILDDGSPTQIWDLLVFYDQLWGTPTPPTQMQIYVTGNTLVDERRAVAKASQWAEVQGLALAPDKLQADTIHLEQPTPITIGGLVQRTSNKNRQTAATGEWWLVGEWRVWVENSVAPTAVAGILAADSQVTIKGFLLGNGVIWAGSLPGTSSAEQ